MAEVSPLARSEIGTAATSDLRGSGPCLAKWRRSAPLQTNSTASFRLAWWRRRTALSSASGRLTVAKARVSETVAFSRVRGARPRLLTLFERFTLARRFAKIAADLMGVEGVRIYHDQALFKEPGDHAGALETAAMQHVAPHLVVPDRATWGDGRARPSALVGVRGGWAWMPRRWTQLTDDTGVGRPHEATAETGATFVMQAVERITHFCIQLSVADPEALWRDDP